MRLVYELLMQVPSGSGWFRVVPSGFVLFVLIHIAFPASVSWRHFPNFVPCLLGVKS